MSVYESAILVSALKAPSRLNMMSSPILTKKRASLVLNKMLSLGLITKLEFEDQSLKLESFKLKNYFSSESRYFADWILRRTSKNYNNISDIKIKSTLGANIQNISEKAALIILGDRNDLEVSVEDIDRTG